MFTLARIRIGLTQRVFLLSSAACPACFTHPKISKTWAHFFFWFARQELLLAVSTPCSIINVLRYSSAMPEWICNPTRCQKPKDEPAWDKATLNREIWGICGEDYGLLRCDVSGLGRWLPTFREKVSLAQRRTQVRNEYRGTLKHRRRRHQASPKRRLRLTQSRSVMPEKILSLGQTLFCEVSLSNTTTGQGIQLGTECT